MFELSSYASYLIRVVIDLLDEGMRQEFRNRRSFFVVFDKASEMERKSHHDDKKSKKKVE